LFWKNIETEEYGGEPNVGGGSWSPDSRHLVYWQGENGGYVLSLKIVNILDSTVKLVSDLSDKDAPYGSPRWSPDGDKILFVMDLDTWVIDTSGQNLKRLARDALDPAWSPDGEQIVFTKCDEDGKLWIMDADGENQRPIREE
jgi:Tol biopolymer transport system component